MQRGSMTTMVTSPLLRSSGEKAWQKPYLELESLHFRLIGNDDEEMTNEVYTVYHCRLTEMLLTHFSDDFKSFVMYSLESSFEF